MKVIYESIFDKMERAIQEAEKLGKTILKFVVNPSELEELWPSIGGGANPKKLFYSLIPVEVEN